LALALCCWWLYIFVFEFAHNQHTGKSPQAQSIKPHKSQDTTLRTFLEGYQALQHEWIQSALYILVKHNHKFMEGMGEYATSLWLGKILLIIGKMCSPDCLIALRAGFPWLVALGYALGWRWQRKFCPGTTLAQHAFSCMVLRALCSIIRVVPVEGEK